jgi:Tfp pilus assembly protein PilN
LINLEPGGIDVAVVSEGQLLFTRSSALDIQNSQPEVAGRRLGEEVARSFTAYMNEFRQKPLSHVYLSGGSTERNQGEWIEHALTDVMEMPISRLQSRLLPPSDPESRSYAVAAGLALQTGQGSIAGVNLVPNERAVKKALQQRRIQQQLAVVGVCALIVLGIVFTKNMMEAQSKLQKDTNAANNELTEETAKFTAAKKTYDRVHGLETELIKGLDRNHPSVDILVALNQSMPSSAQIWLTQMAFERNGLLTLRGDSKTPQAATELVLNLQKSGAFTDVKLSYLGDAQDTGSNDTVAVAPAVKAPTPTTPTVPALAGFPTANPGGTNPSLAGGNPGGSPGGFNGYRGGLNGAGGGVNGTGVPTGVAPGSPGGFNPNSIPPGSGVAPQGQPSSGPPPPIVVPNGGGASLTNPAPNTGRIVYTPDMAARSQGGGNPAPSGAPTFDPSRMAAGNQGVADVTGASFGGFRQRGRRNGGNFTGDPSSIQTNPGQNPSSGTPTSTASAPTTNSTVRTTSPPTTTSKVVTKPVVTKPTVVPKAPKQILTSFVITCRVNTRKNALITAGVPGGKSKTTSNLKETAKSSAKGVDSTDDDPGDLGDDNADPQ